MSKTKGKVLGGLLIISVVIALLLGWQLHRVSSENQELQFVQDRIDTDFVTALSSLNSDWLGSDPIQRDAVQSDIAQVEVLLPVTTYREIEGLDEIVKEFVYKAKKAETGGENEELWEAISMLTSHLSKPLPDDINKFVEDAWNKLQ